MGISYGGISQLFVAATRPPSLAAITPLSVIDNTATTLYPGGILNTGFALSWAKDRVHDAQPASATGGQAWALKRIQGGDTTCKANQALHPEAVDLLRQDRRPTASTCPKVADPLAPVTFVHKIKAPVVPGLPVDRRADRRPLPDLAARFTGHDAASGSRSPTARTSTRSTRRRSTAGTTSSSSTSRAARRTCSPALKAPGADGLQRRDGRPGRDAARRPDPGAARPTPRRCAAFEAHAAGAHPVRQRRRRPAPGAPVPGFEQSFARFPLPGTPPRVVVPRRRRGARRRRDRRDARDAFTWDKPRGRRPASPATPGSGGLWTATPPYHWAAEPGRHARSPT